RGLPRTPFAARPFTVAMLRRTAVARAAAVRAASYAGLRPRATSRYCLLPTASYKRPLLKQHTHRRADPCRFPDRSEAACDGIHPKHGQRVRLLVGRNEPPPSWVERKVSRCLATSRGVL